MSYNTRRGPNTGFGGGNVGNIGSRRPQPAGGNNYVTTTQLTPQKQPGQQGQNQQGQVAANVRGPTQQFKQPAQQTFPAQNNVQQTLPPPQQVPQQQQIKQNNVPQAQPIESMKMEDEVQGVAEGGADGKKAFRPKGPKLPKKEKIRRRNLRLGKILQPKNALMILNELVKNPIYNVFDITTPEGIQHKATVLVEGMEHVGYGKSKVQAKSAAAETALRYLVKNHKLTSIRKEDEGEQMQVDEDGPLPWQHVACFALFKLFSSWGENPNFKEDGAPKEHKPAKQLPANANAMNPLMLLHQMLPQTQFQEVARVGNPPNIAFTMKCSVDGKEFCGTGPSKKAAKKLAAFEACRSLLGIQYPPEVYTPVATQ